MPVPTTLWAKQIYDLGAAPKELNSQVPTVMTGDSFNKSLRAVVVISYTFYCHLVHSYWSGWFERTVSGSVERTSLLVAGNKHTTLDGE